MSHEKTLNKWIPKKENGRPRKNRVAIYDFDGTIFRSPDREAGEAVYFETTGELLPFPGWWGRLESLMPPIVPEKPGNEWYIQETVDAYRKDSTDEDVELILMTGRPYKRKHRVIEICDHLDLKFHEYYFRGMKGQQGSNTFEIKSNIIHDELIHPKLEILEIWEDRPDHISAFLDLAKNLKSKYRNHLREVVIHNVPTGEKHSI